VDEILLFCLPEDLTFLFLGIPSLLSPSSLPDPYKTKQGTHQYYRGYETFLSRHGSMAIDFQNNESQRLKRLEESGTMLPQKISSMGPE